MIFMTSFLLETKKNSSEEDAGQIQIKLRLVEFCDLCMVHVIWTERRMLNVKYLLLLSFLTAAEFYNLGHIQGIIRMH